MENVEHIKQFLQESYSDGALLTFRGNCELGNVNVHDPCGCLLGQSDEGYFHYSARRVADLIAGRPLFTDMSRRAELEFMAMGRHTDFDIPEQRKAFGAMILPLIDAEIERRGLSVIKQAEHELATA